MMQLFYAIQFERPLLLVAIIPVLLALLFIIRKDFVKGLRRRDVRKSILRQRFFILATRSLVFAFLIVAMASPFSLQTAVKTGDPSLTVLSDNSTSMSVLDVSGVQAMNEKLQSKIPVKFRSFASGEDSPVGDAVLSTMKGKDNLLLISDGNGNSGRDLGDMLVVASSMNSTINAVNLEASVQDGAVVVTGPRVTTNAEQNEFKVAVKQVGSPQEYELGVYVGDKKVLSGTYSGSKNFSFSETFSEGYHVIKAEIVAKDHFSQNNVFYKTVKVEKKPKILFVSRDKTPLSEVLNALYGTTTVSGLSGQDLGSYSAVVLNDLPESEIPSQRLSDYVTEGNGLVVVGGKSAYDRGGYKDSVFEAMLPVRVGKGQEGEKTEVNVVLVIDISGSTKAGFRAGSHTRVEEVEKALAIGILKDLRPDDRVAVVAFNTDAFIVSDLGKVLGNERYVEDRISRLVYQGGTRIDEGIKAARKILGPLDGSKNMIIFSDGKSSGLSDDLRDARISANTGIKIHTVGVGAGTNRKHMQDIAKAGNGFYFEPGETEKLAVIFGEAEEGDSGSLAVDVINGHHFITYGVKPVASVSGFNQVIPKSNADLLVATQRNNPLVTSSRLGLGRIVAVSTDDGSAWASELLSSKNSVLISRAINWAIGDLGRNKEFDVDVRDVFLGDRMEVNVVSGAEPQHEFLKFSKTSKRGYSAHFTPQSSGIQSFFDAVAAVNYAEEYAILGMNPELKNLVALTGGKLFNPEDSNALVEKVKEDSKRVVSEPRMFSWMFLLAALVVFLSEIIVRLIQEIRRK